MNQNTACVNISINQYATFQYYITYIDSDSNPVTWAGYTGLMDIKDDNGNFIYQLSSSPGSGAKNASWSYKIFSGCLSTPAFVT